MGTSNVIPNSLKFDFHAFKSLTKLVLVDIDLEPDLISSLGMVRHTLTFLQANKCSLASISHILLCDTHHDFRKEDELDEIIKMKKVHLEWHKLEHLDLR